MDERTINFQRERDLGEVLNATFAFIKLNFKAIWKAIFYFLAPLELLSTVFSTVFSLQASSLLESNFQNFSSSFLVLVIILFLKYCVAISLILGLIKWHHEEKSVDFNFKYIWHEIANNFWQVLVISVLVSILFILIWHLRHICMSSTTNVVNKIFIEIHISSKLIISQLLYLSYLSI